MPASLRRRRPGSAPVRPAPRPPCTRVRGGRASLAQQRLAVSAPTPTPTPLSVTHAAHLPDAAERRATRAWTRTWAGPGPQSGALARAPGCRCTRWARSAARGGRWWVSCPAAGGARKGRWQSGTRVGTGAGRTHSARQGAPSPKRVCSRELLAARGVPPLSTSAFVRARACARGGSKEERALVLGLPICKQRRCLASHAPMRPCPRTHTYLQPCATPSSPLPRPQPHTHARSPAGRSAIGMLRQPRPHPGTCGARRLPRRWVCRRWACCWGGQPAGMEAPRGHCGVRGPGRQGVPCPTLLRTQPPAPCQACACTDARRAWPGAGDS